MAVLGVSTQSTTVSGFWGSMLCELWFQFALDAISAAADCLVHGWPCGAGAPAEYRFRGADAVSVECAFGRRVGGCRVDKSWSPHRTDRTADRAAGFTCASASRRIIKRIF